MPSNSTLAAVALAVGLVIGASVTGLAVGVVALTSTDTGPTHPSWGYQKQSGCTDHVRGERQHLSVSREPQGETVRVEATGRVTYSHGQQLELAVFDTDIRQYVVWLNPVTDTDHDSHDGGCPLAASLSMHATVDDGYHCIRVIYNGTTVETYRNETARDPCS